MLPGMRWKELPQYFLLCRGLFCSSQWVELAIVEAHLSGMCPQARSFVCIRNKDRCLQVTKVTQVVLKSRGGLFPSSGSLLAWQTPIRTSRLRERLSLSPRKEQNPQSVDKWFCLVFEILFVFVLGSRFVFTYLCKNAL